MAPLSILSRPLSPARPRIAVAVDAPFRSRVKSAWVREAARAALAASSAKAGPVELSIRIADDNAVHEMNRRFRGVDRTTDVLTFAFRESANGATFPLAGDGVTPLGDVIISYPQMERQAIEYGTTPKEELAFLVIHGALHALGYDHERSPKERRLMRSLEQQALDSLGLRARS
ncbi:MAG: rRNA maturation RNase YbeY [Chloroflexi bacterium]|nr:rRNA maturation RNase YbeY [Chloroflexota bacterium]